jgi:hypothetical protein
MTIAAIQSELIVDASASSIAAENSREQGASTKRYGPMQALAREAFRTRTTTKAKFGGYRSCLPTTWSGLLLRKPDHPALAHAPLPKRGTRIRLDTCYSLWFSAGTSAIVIAIIAQPIVGPWRPYRLPKERYDLAPSCGP